MPATVKTLPEAAPGIPRTNPVTDVLGVMGYLPSMVGYSLESPSCISEQFESPSPDDDITTPLLINPSVLDSVFSSVLDDHSGVQDHSPMFDDLELGPESEWELLFAGDLAIKRETAPLVEFGPEEQILANPGPKLDAEKPSRKRARSLSDCVLKQVPIQVATPLTTPVLDMSKKPKLDKFGCVAYSKKHRSRPLEPIEPVGDDPISMKRAKNTEAARRSRARKMERMGQLEEKIEVLVTEKESLLMEVDRLRQLLLESKVPF